jgi:steroid 5-alpha reductase family enzyme
MNHSKCNIHCFLKYRKGGYYWSGQDYRYPYLRKKLGAVGMALLNIIFIAPAQNYILLLIVTPLYVINSVSASSMMRETNLTSLDYITVTLHLMFLLLESVADEQMYFFQTEKYALLSHLESHQLKGDYKLGFLWHSGLFQYSRHPNFFAEQLMWWVIYLFSVSAVQVASGLSDLSTYLNWTIAGPIVLTSLFQGSTWLTEVVTNKALCVCVTLKKKGRFMI